MALNIGVESQHELNAAFVLRDVRTFSQKVGDWMRQPLNFRNAMIGFCVFLLIFPGAIIPTLAITGIMALYWNALKRNHIRLPFRMPMWANVPDPSTLEDKAKSPWPANGIAFLGNQKAGNYSKGGEELWLSDSDSRTHRLVMGTTGAGKTNTLLSWLLNSLAWGSGFTYSDGKAQNDVFLKVFGMAALLWREDDVLVVNYMMGGEDQFASIAKSSRAVRNRKSNTMNPFGSATNEAINQMLSSMMGKAGGDGGQWQAKAINMMSGVTLVSAYLRATGERRLSVKTLRESMNLPTMIELNKRSDIPEVAIQGIRAYLSVGLPGYNPDAAKAGKAQAQTCLDQHGYLTGQFTRTLGMLNDSYSHIFRDTLPEVDMLDCVLNNRILFVMIPTLEKSTEEAANLGRIVVMAAKMMMASNLGAEIEGDTTDLIENRPTSYSRPYDIFLDELGYYFASGIDLMFAQGRSLGIALTASGQDFQAMAKGENKNEVESMIANTRLKVGLKCEDPKETFEVFQRSAGKAFVAQVSGYESGSGSNLFSSNSTASVQSVDRITLQELKDVGPGDGLLIMGSKVIRASMYDIFQDFKVPAFDMRINTLLPISSPTIGEIAGLCRASTQDKTASIMSLMQGGQPPFYNNMHAASPITCALQGAIERMPENTSAVERGIVLFIAAKRALDKKRVSGNSSGSSSGSGSPSPKKADNTDEMEFLFERDPLEWVDNPPIQEAIAAEKNGKPDAKADTDDWGSDAVTATEFGITSTENRSIEFTDEAKQEVIRVMAGMGAGRNTDSVEAEVERMRGQIERAVEFKRPDKGREELPLALDNVEDIMNLFDGLQGAMDSDGTER